MNFVFLAQFQVLMKPYRRATYNFVIDKIQLVILVLRHLKTALAIKRTLNLSAAFPSSTGYSTERGLVSCSSGCLRRGLLLTATSNIRSKHTLILYNAITHSTTNTITINQRFSWRVQPQYCDDMIMIIFIVLCLFVFS